MPLSRRDNARRNPRKTCIERLQTSGILRRGNRRVGFRYRYASGGRVRRDQIERIKGLGLPPAWRAVAIAPSASARVQAIGRDAAGRWQYVYHPQHVRQRERQKFLRLLQFGAALPRLRAAGARHMHLRGLPREKVLATIMRILSGALIRPGSEVYAAENGSYGLATLRRKHVRICGHTIIFDFPAKSRKRGHRKLDDAPAARVVRRLLRLPGYEVFKYITENGTIADIRRADITAYIREHMGAAFSAKDFRTWTATLICACALARALDVTEKNERARKRTIVAALRETATLLGNTAAVCRSSYVSPCVLSAFHAGSVVDTPAAAGDLATMPARRLRGCERALLRLLRSSTR